MSPLIVDLFAGANERITTNREQAIALPFWQAMASAKVLGDHASLLCESDIVSLLAPSLPSS